MMDAQAKAKILFNELLTWRERNDRRDRVWVESILKAWGAVAR